MDDQLGINGVDKTELLYKILLITVIIRSKLTYLILGRFE